MEDPTPTPSSSKGLPQGLDPSREALTQGRLTDLRALRGTLWGCRAAHPPLWVACSMDSRSVIIDFPCIFIVTLHNLSFEVTAWLKWLDFSLTFPSLCSTWINEMNLLSVIYHAIVVIWCLCGFTFSKVWEFCWHSLKKSNKWIFKTMHL